MYASNLILSPQLMSLWLVGLIIIFYVFKRGILMLVSQVLLSIPFPRKILRFKDIYISKPIAALGIIISSPILVFSFVESNLLSLDYFPISPIANIIVFSAIPLFFYLYIESILYIGYKYKIRISREIRVLFLGFYILILFLAFLGLTSMLFSPIIGVVDLSGIMLVATLILVLSYFFQLIRVFIVSQISIFFSFLYLCALEILPLALVFIY